MGFVFHHKHHVGGNVAGGFISLLRKGDLCPLLPTPLDVHRQDLVLIAHGAAVRVQPLAGNLHLFGAARVNLLQAHLQLVHHGRVLLSLLVSSVSRSLVGLEGSLEATHAAHPAHAKRPEGVVDVHVVVTGVRKEMVEGAAATEELGKHGVRVSMEGVVVAWTTLASSTTSGRPF